MRREPLAVDAVQEKYQRVLAVKQAYESELMAKPNVVGIGVGFRQRRGETTSEVALVVMVREKLPRAQLAPEDIIPAEIESVPVDVLEVGDIEAHS
ncbi:MAG: hypothetical protein PVJ32_01900 [Anaerolineales bacterium]|jgi:hypothetical protein